MKTLNSFWMKFFIHKRFSIALFSKLLLWICVCGSVCSCGPWRDKTYLIQYQSIRTKYAQPTKENPIPEEAEIAVAYTISTDGELNAIVYNRTSEIMVIDQTQSFFVNSDGRSVSYYDPTVRTTSTTDLSSKTKGASVNLGTIAGVLGIGGIVGDIASGVNVAGSGTSGQSITHATYMVDQPRVSLGPKGSAAMSKTFQIEFLKYAMQNETISPLLSREQSPCRFSVCISYSLDNGKTFEKLVTDFYAESLLNVPLRSEGKVNDALTVVTQNKPDMYNTPWWRLWFVNKRSYTPDQTCALSGGVIYDYQ